MQVPVISGEGSCFVAYSLSSLSSGASKYSKYFSLRSSANRPRALSTGGGETQLGGGECYDQGTLSKAKRTFMFGAFNTSRQQFLYKEDGIITLGYTCMHF